MITSTIQLDRPEKIDIQKSINELRQHLTRLRQSLPECHELAESVQKLAKDAESRRSRTAIRAGSRESYSLHALPTSRRQIPSNPEFPIVKPRLSLRQIEVVRLVSLGCTTAEIGAILGISRSTADNYKTKAMELLGAGKAALLTRLAIKYRFTSPTDKLTDAEKLKCGVKSDGWN